MKLIHCADLHLNSRLRAHLSTDEARKRNEELTASFLNMVEYAHTEGVSAILIAGDLFDRSSVPSGLRNTLVHTIEKYPDILFFYLKGNHDDNDTFVGSLETVPANLKCFRSGEWTAYSVPLSFGHTLTVTGIEEGKPVPYESLRLDEHEFNIVMMHGNISSDIDLKRLRNHYIDYLALGHIHSWQKGDLPSRGIWCYSGCLEGRGFDETGEHGFVLLEIDEERMKGKNTFIPFAKRHVHVIPVDVSGCSSTIEMKEMAEKKLAGTAEPQDMVRIVLKGDVDALAEKNPTALEKMLESRFFHVEVEDETRLAVNYQDYAKDASLKGEFVRAVQKDSSLSEQMKSEVIRCGIQALNGETL